MCGRFVRFSPIPKLIKRFKIEHLTPIELKKSHNISPSQDVLIVNKELKRQLIIARWGFIPSWVKDPSVGNNIINARAETIAKKPSFRHAFKKTRCLIIADGFYEWMKAGPRKTPMFIHTVSNKAFALAGLYNIWTSPENETIYTCTIITTQANELIKPFHDRMPVILSKGDEDLWLDTKAEDDDLQSLLVPYDPDEMEAWEVAPAVNRPGFDRPENILPV
jgi:putative SOS response-associated peptidase YedK